MLHKLIAALMIIAFASSGVYAIDLGNESTADKADRFDFEEFHKEKGITLWEDKKDKVVEPSKATTVKKTDPAAEFEKGQVLKVREPYKLGHDPLRSTQSLFEAMEALHKQLNGYCPHGWIKDREWYQPDNGLDYIYYEAICL